MSQGDAVYVRITAHCLEVAEKTFLQLRRLANSDPGTIYIAVSHSDKAATHQWLTDIGGRGEVQVVVDEDRKIYAAWGLGPSSFWHVLNPMALMTVYHTGKQDGIRVRPTQSGTRWQTAGSFAVDGKGFVAWGRPSERADDVPNLEEARKAVSG